MGWLSLLTKGKKVAGAIKSFKPAKNLTKRRADFEDIVKAVDKHGKTAKSSKIKRDAAIKVSKIHDKYEAIKASGKK
jgi:hypothetical protein